VRLFSPWDLDASPRARARLAAAGRPVPEGAECPTGAELVERLLVPLAELPVIASNLRIGARVVEVSRDGLVKSDEIGTGKRAERPFRLLVEDASGRERIERADVVLDCTGTWSSPNRLGDGGIPAPGERAAEASGLIQRYPPDLADAAEAERWAGRTVLVAGAGHSAQTAVRDLAALAAGRPGTRVIWALRGEAPAWGRVADDPLPERARLAAAAEALAGGSSPVVEARRGVVVESLEPAGDRLRVTLRRRAANGAGPGAVETVEVDRVLSLTGYAGDHRLYRQLQVHECYATSGPMKLSAALLGSGSGAGGGDCLAQPSHGADVLVNPEPGFYLLGSKSYGRNTTFLMRAGWQQVDDVMGLIAAG
jgi:hypothetical protein